MGEDVIKKNQIIARLAEHIGVEPDDINEDDFFLEDLHMNATEMSDFVHSLTDLGFDVSKLDLASLETVSDLLEGLGASEPV
jgi:acyl carrier protein